MGDANEQEEQLPARDAANVAREEAERNVKATWHREQKSAVCDA